MSDTPKPALNFTAVDFSYDDTAALNSIDLTLDRGQHLALVGPSGCGKSTLLRLAAGLLEPTDGTITLASDRVGFIFQTPTLLPWRTVARNVELLAELDNVGKAERANRTAEAINLVGLSGFENHYPTALSGGMAMRVSLARTLANQPTVFFLDEPFAALDELTRHRLNEELQHMYATEAASLFVSHSVTEAAFMANRVLVLSARPGRVVADIDVPFPFPRSSELRFNPAFVATCANVSQALQAEAELGELWQS